MLNSTSTTLRVPFSLLVGRMSLVRRPTLARNGRAFADSSKSTKDEDSGSQTTIHPAYSNPKATPRAVNSQKPDFDLMVIGSGPGKHLQCEVAALLA